MGRLKMENEKLKEKLWTSKLKVKDLIQKLYEKDSQLEEKGDKIEMLENKIRELLGKESSEASVLQDKDFDEQMDTDEEVGEGTEDDDELEILEPPPKVFEEVTLDEDADDIAPSSESVNQTRSLEEENPTSKDSDRSTAPTAPHSKLAGKGNCFDSEAQVKSGNPKSVSENILKREKVVKGIQESLALRQSADHDDKVARKSTKDLLNIGKKIEKSLFRQFDGVSKKYTMKYRSIVQNIRNPQNEVLFRQILLSKISPRELVMMNTSDYAQSTGLGEFREEQKRKELVAIANDEMQRRSRSSGKVLLKSNQGEREVEALVKDNLGPDKEELALLQQLGVDKID